jgi:alginate O-acetyltransferase complex protein AlgI
MLRLMFGFSGQAAWNMQGGLLLRENILFFAIAFFAATPLAARMSRQLIQLQQNGERRRLITVVATSFQFMLLFICTASLVGSTYNPFLYFRF